MAKINTKKYAIALYEAVRDNKGEQLKLALQNFVKLLVKKRRLNQIEKIISDFKKHYNEAEGIIEIETQTAFHLSEQEKNKIINKLELILRKKIELKSLVNRDLLGGIILRFNDILVDGSLRTQLDNLRKRLV